MAPRTKRIIIGPAVATGGGEIDPLASDLNGGGIAIDGRPGDSGSDSGGGDGYGGIDPAAIGGTPGDGGGDSSDGRKRRGRKPGSGSATRKKAPDKDSVETLSRLLLVVHQGFSVVTKTPELALTEMEADMLAKPTADLLSQFDLKPDPRFEATIAVIMAAGFVYGPRIVLIRDRIAKETKEKTMRNVTPLRPVPTPPKAEQPDPSPVSPLDAAMAATMGAPPPPII